MFSYPLTLEEIERFSSVREPNNEVEKLVESGLVQQLEPNFYCLKASKADLQDRILGNERAEKLRAKAIRKANFIGQFPFVKSVSISGSMSKGYMDRDADLDFFIITEPGRLWIARTLLILFKKIFLLNSRKYFCINYLVDTEHLEIEEQNRFTATELVTLIGVYGNGEFEDFCRANDWAYKIFPNAKNVRWKGNAHDSWFKRLNQRILGGKIGDRLDNYFMKITLKRWQKKFGSMNPKHFEVAFKTRTYVSKHHPGNFQQKVLSKSEEILEKLKTEHHLQWED